MNLKTSEIFKLFDSLVGSVLGYAGEVWGIHGVQISNDCIHNFVEVFLALKNPPI